MFPLGFHFADAHLFETSSGSRIGGDPRISCDAVIYNGHAPTLANCDWTKAAS